MPTILSHAVGPFISHTEYGFLLPANATVLSVKRNGANVAYVITGAPRNPRVSEPPEGGGWANGVISIELA